jgi:pimeloyl-ACP methyl ester carboxylesterase
MELPRCAGYLCMKGEGFVTRRPFLNAYIFTSKSAFKNLPSFNAAMPHKVLSCQDGATIAYEQSEGASPGVVFLHGLMSDRGGTKARTLAAHCAAKGYGFVRFDMFGHGDSSGRFEDGGVSRWAEDAIAVLDHLTRGPQIVVGSSMGGWVMVRAALARPDRVAGMLGIAPAPDFTADQMWPEFSDDQRAALMRDGVIEIPSDYGDGPYRISRHLIEDGRKNLVLTRNIPITCPVRLIHGQRDTAVPWRRSLMLAERLTGTDVEIHLIKDGDHRLSQPHELACICAGLDELVDRYRSTQS